MAVRTWDLDPAASTLTVTARATLHDATSRGAGLGGRLFGDPDDLEATAGGEVQVPLGELRFGDKLRDFAMARHLELARWPEARFVVSGVDVLSRSPWRVRVRGSLHWRDRQTPLSVEATGSIEGKLDARATFDLDIPSLGVTPPRLLFMKVADLVRVEVRLVGALVEW